MWDSTTLLAAGSKACLSFCFSHSFWFWSASPWWLVKLCFFKIWFLPISIPFEKCSFGNFVHFLNRWGASWLLLLSTNKLMWEGNMGCKYNGILFTYGKKNEVMILAVKWEEIKGIMLSEMSQMKVLHIHSRVGFFFWSVDVNLNYWELDAWESREWREGGWIWLGVTVLSVMQQWRDHSSQWIIMHYIKEWRKRADRLQIWRKGGR